MSEQSAESVSLPDSGVAEVVAQVSELSVESKPEEHVVESVAPCSESVQEPCAESCSDKGPGECHSEAAQAPSAESCGEAVSEESQPASTSESQWIFIQIFGILIKRMIFLMYNTNFLKFICKSLGFANRKVFLVLQVKHESN